jgi:predicted DNA-binding transcriptional regulator AlpA
MSMERSATVTMREAAAILGVSPAKMWQLVKQGVLTTQPNPLDRRQKLVRVVDLERLQENEPRPRPNIVGIVSDGSLQSTDVEDYMREHWRPWEC